MLTALEQFEMAWLNDLSPIIWVDQLSITSGLPFLPREKQRALALLKQIEYLPEQEPREILLCAGLIAANPTTLNAVHTLNQTKNDFKEAIQDLKLAKIPVSDPELQKKFQISLNSRPSPISYTLRKTGLARLHLKQCYRLVPILPYQPLKVSWTWANTRSIKRISIAEAERLLLKRGSDVGIIRQLEKLGQLKHSEVLAIVQNLAPHLRANIVSLVEGEIVRKMIKGPVPIFYPYDPNKIVPTIQKPGKKQGRNKSRLIRSDVKLDPVPFLPAIRAHRYIY